MLAPSTKVGNCEIVTLVQSVQPEIRQGQPPEEPIEDFSRIVGVCASTACRWMNTNQVGKAEFMGKTHVLISEPHDRFHDIEVAVAATDRGHSYTIELALDEYNLRKGPKAAPKKPTQRKNK